MQNSTLFSDNRKIYRLLPYVDSNIKDGRENLDCFYEIVAEQFFTDNLYIISCNLSIPFQVYIELDTIRWTFELSQYCNT